MEIQLLKENTEIDAFMKIKFTFKSLTKQLIKLIVKLQPLYQAMLIDKQLEKQTFYRQKDFTISLP